MSTSKASESKGEENDALIRDKTTDECEVAVATERLQALTHSTGFEDTEGNMSVRTVNKVLLYFALKRGFPNSYYIPMFGPGARHKFNESSHHKVISTDPQAT